MSFKDYFLEEEKMKTIEKFSKPAKRRILATAATPTNKISALSLKRELNNWLEKRDTWNHDDWLKLLSDLRTKGYNDLIDTPKGQEAIGLYLEAHKKTPQ